MSRPSLRELENHADFIQRHIGPTVNQQREMAQAIGYDSLDALIDDTVPATIRRAEVMDLPGPRTEQEAIARLRELAAKNQVNKYPRVAWKRCSPISRWLWT
jgi:glycine dehydrogenase